MLAYFVSGAPLSDEAVGAHIGVNPYKLPGLRGWFCKLGLGEATSKQYRLSAFGTLVANHDTRLRRIGTLWLLHYFLASEHEERSEVWYQCFNAFLQPGKVFSGDELREYIERSLPETPSNKEGVSKDVQELIRTYTRESGLGGLGLLVRQVDKTLVARTDCIPDPMIAAYVLFDTWQRRYSHTNTLHLSQLVNEPEMPGRVFVAHDTRVRELVLRLQSEGLLSYADTQHQQVTRSFHDDPTLLLQQYYQRL
jgi:hypothetical protein